jgi:DNA-binding protein H-NS
MTWTGRGKKPKWVVDALAGGRNIDDLLIRS